jgi:O-antigen/teichoic acid export membrane protein
LFFKDSVHTLIVRVFGYLFALGVQVIIARFLGPGAKGELQIAMFLFAVIGMLIGLGFERSIIYFLGRDKYDLKRIWYNGCAFLLLSSIFAVIFWLPLTYLAMPLFGEIRFELLALVFIMAPLDRLMSFQLGVFNGRGEIRKGNRFSLQNSIIYAVLVAIIVIWIMPRSDSVLLAYSCAFFITIVTVLIYWKKHLGLTLGLSLNREIQKSMLAFGTKGQIGNITHMIATRLDLLIMNYYLGKASAGVYSVAINFGDLLLFLPFILSYVIFPHASRRTPDQGWILIQKIARIALLISFVMALAIALIAPVAVPILFSNEFVGAVQPLWILLCGIIFLASFRIIASGVSGLGYPAVYSICTLVAVGVSLTLNLLLVPEYQAMGAAFSNAIAYFLTFLSLLAIIKIKFRQRLLPFFVIRKQDFREILTSAKALLGKREDR